MDIWKTAGSVGACRGASFIPGGFAMPTLTCTSVAACLREAAASPRSRLKEGDDFYPP